MEINIYKKYASERIEENFQKLSPYFELQTNLFSGIAQLMNENFRCLILDAHIGSITLSNHILERLLKIALIYHESLHEGEEASVKAYNKYQGMALRTSITNCFNRSLIDLDQKTFLEKFINNMIRNGFSHSSFESILAKEPFKIKGVMGNLSNSELKHVEIDRRHFISISELKMEKFAEEHAFEYYKYLYDLIESLDKKIKPEE
mgnify:CR=1 FL=1